MRNFFQNEKKLKIFSQIQKNLCELEENASDEKIDLLVNKISPNLLSQKDDLMTICELFTYYIRNYNKYSKKNGIRLMSKILQPIKDHLQGESSFLWNICGGNMYLKLWLFKENLISIDQIINSAQIHNTNIIAEYFLPEIVKYNPEYYEKEIQFKIQKKYTKEDIYNFEKLREKHIKWYLSTNDYHDPVYPEIETNHLRLAIKTDDFDNFQKILSESNISKTTKIEESVIESFLLYPRPRSLLDYSIHFKAINIVKFLILNEVEIGQTRQQLFE